MTSKCSPWYDMSMRCNSLLGEQGPSDCVALARIHQRSARKSRGPFVNRQDHKGHLLRQRIVLRHVNTQLSGSQGQCTRGHWQSFFTLCNPRDRCFQGGDAATCARPRVDYTMSGTYRRIAALNAAFPRAPASCERNASASPAKNFALPLFSSRKDPCRARQINLGAGEGTGNFTGARETGCSIWNNMQVHCVCCDGMARRPRRNGALHAPIAPCPQDHEAQRRVRLPLPINADRDGLAPVRLAP